MKTNTLSLIISLLASFAFLQATQAVSPPPDGGYAGFTTAEGANALQNLTTGVGNTATGWRSLFANGAGNLNTAVGAGTLLFNTGDNNTATGALALLRNTTGINNTATGTGALSSNTTGNANSAYGSAALGNITTGNLNIGLGDGAGTNVITANNVICIGAAGADASNTTWISNVYGATTLSGTTLPVVVSDGGQLGTTASSARFKKQIKPMDKTSESVLALKPVTFRYKSDKTNTAQFGLVAEEVAAVDPDLVVRDKNGEVYTVRYDAVNAMLLNEFLKEHKAFVEQQRELEQQGATIARQQKQIDALTTVVKKVSTQLEVSKAAPQTVVNNE
jgi:trimeric autotransporter adhesin